ncbi:MAG: RDD family protein [Planctomycetes bacterium]|nr:RDD family protein [Planctomycetota bacterium]
MNDLQPPPLKPKLPPLGDQDSDEWKRMLLERLELQRKRVKLVRTLAIAFAFVIIGVGFAVTFMSPSELSPNALRIVPLNDGGTLIARNTHAAMDASTWHQFGRVEGNSVRWGSKRSGEVRSFELNDRGQAIAIMDTRARLFENIDDILKEGDQGKIIRLSSDISDNAGILADDDGVSTAWISQGKLLVSLGEGLDRVPFELEGVDGSSNLAALVSLGNGRKMLVARIPQATKKAKSDAKTGQRLVAVCFSIESMTDEEINALASSETPSSDPEAAKEGASEHQPEDTEKSATGSAPDEDGVPESNSDPEKGNSSDETQEKKEDTELPPVKRWIAKDVHVETLHDAIEFFWFADLGSRVAVFYRVVGETQYRVTLGGDLKEGKFSDPVDVSESLNEPLGRMYSSQASFLGPTVANYRLPHIYGFQDKLRLYRIDGKAHQLTVFDAHVDEAGTIGEFAEVKTIEIERVGIGIPEGVPMYVMFAAFAGLIACVIWLGVNRPIDAEELLRTLVIDKTGRDTAKLEAPVGKNAADMIPWAGLIRRGIALMIDYMICLPLIYFLADSAGFSTEDAMDLFRMSVEYPLDGLVERTLGFAVIGTYAIACESLWGRTLGKRILGMRVVTAKGQGLGEGRVFIRNFIRVIELCHPLLMMGAMFAVIFTRKHQRIGDLLAGSAVRIEFPSEDDPTVQEPSDLS